jgi:hypothetical protein
VKPLFQQLNPEAQSEASLRTSAVYSHARQKGKLMKLKLLSLAIIAALFAVPLTSNSAHADDCSQSSSLIQTSDGKCFDLSYLTVLGRSRKNLQEASNSYIRATQVYRTKPSTYLIETAVSSRSVTSVVTASVYYPTREEQLENQEIVRRMGNNLQRLCCMIKKWTRLALKQAWY